MERSRAWDRRAWLFGSAWRSLSPPHEPGPAAELTVARRAMACEFSVTLPGAHRHATAAACAALDEVDRIERELSAYDDDSPLCGINRSAAERPVPIGPEMHSLLAEAGRLHAETGGAFDPAAGALIEAWGFLRGPPRAPSATEIDAALKASGWRHVRLEKDSISFARPGVALNLGAFGKGYAIDRALDVLRRRGICCALVQGGRSSLKALGEPAGGWTIAVGDPRRPGRIAAHVRLHEEALGTSGADHRFFEAGGRRHGHILDPRSGWPSQGQGQDQEVIGASAIASSAAEADALSTAFFVLGEAATRSYCREHPGIGAVLVLPEDVVVIGAADAEVLD